MGYTDEQQREFRALTEPLVEWLNANCHPHARAEVTPTGAELLEGSMVYHTVEHVGD